MEKSKTKDKEGRPLIEFDWGEFKSLCKLQCTLIEIAGWFKCSEKTIERACKREQEMSFVDYYKKHSQEGKISLRRQQYKKAMEGNITMLIWLGKQMLGQADKSEILQKDIQIIIDEQDKNA